jgi:serine/threonine protein kinase
MIGQTLDRYRIEAKLGEGGMGVVYKAHDTRLNRVVAIKVLPHDKVADPERKQRFAQEARAASALNHANIVGVHDIRSEGAIDFIVMEYATGQTLDRIIAAGRLEIVTALRYAVQIASALAAAHGAGIVHRDLKPSNVVVSADDRVKVLDFGLAKLVEPAGGAEATTQTSPLTANGLVVGTAAYMSPEQAAGRSVDARTDIFSFGAMLYEMVTGRRPFVGDSPLSMLAKILNEDPAAPTTIVATVPPEVERTILRCLRKDPARRYQTMADLKVALEDLVTDSTGGAPAQTLTSRPPRARRLAWVPIIPVVLAGAYFASQSTRPAPDAPAPTRPVPLTALPGVVRYPSFSPDGNHVAFTWNGPKRDNTDVYVQQIGAGAPLRLTTDPANDSAAAWSPDGRSIAFLRQQEDRRSELRLVPPLGGPERKVADLRPHGAFLRPVTLDWCPDSSCVVVSDAVDETTQVDALFVVAIETGEKRPLTSPPASFLADSDPAVSPDGLWLVFRRDAAPFSGQLLLLALGAGVTAAGEPRRLTTTQLNAYAPDWISNDEIVLSARRSLWRMGIAPGRSPTRLPFAGEDGLQPAVSRPGPGRSVRLAYVRSFADANIWRVETSAAGAPASSPPFVAIASTRRDAISQFSPDDRRVVFVSDRSGESEIWVSDASGSGAMQLTSMGANPGFPRWSPDGKTIAFHSNPEGQGDIFVVSAEGGKPRQITSGPATDAFASFSRDGQWIYFISTRTAIATIWKAPASGGPAIQVSPRAARMALESPDGAFVYFVEAASLERPGSLWRLPVRGGDSIKVLDGVSAVSFDILENGVYYVRRVADEAQLHYFDFATRRSTTVAENLGNILFGLTASRDGRVIMYSRIDSSVDDLMLVENFR